MNSNCLYCNHDLVDLMNWDTLCEEFITCPNCENKLVVCYDEDFNGDEEYSYWWVEKHENE